MKTVKIVCDICENDLITDSEYNSVNVTINIYKMELHICKKCEKVALDILKDIDWSKHIKNESARNKIMNALKSIKPL